MKWFKCVFDIDTGVRYDHYVTAVCAFDAQEALDILRKSRDICSCKEDTIVNFTAEPMELCYGEIVAFSRD